MKIGHWIYAGLLACSFWACQSTEPSPGARSQEGGSALVEQGTDMETICVPMQEHSVRIAKNDGEKALQQWWDSLPKPLQSKIKSKEVGLQLVSNSSQGKAQPQIDETAKELERIIGAPAELTVSATTQEIKGGENAGGETMTGIQLLQKVPVKLSEFGGQIFLRKGELTQENVQSLHYWWLSLPQDLQDKIKRREIGVEITCVTIDKGDLDLQHPGRLSARADEFAAIAADVLSEMVGYYRSGKQSLPVAKIDSKAIIEKSNAKTLHYPAPQYLQIQLHTLRETLPAPQTM